MNAQIIAIISGLGMAILGYFYKRFKKVGGRDVESFTNYVYRGIKYYVGRFVRRQLAGELALRQYARANLGRPATMLVPAARPVHLNIDSAFVPLFLKRSTGEQ